MFAEQSWQLQTLKDEGDVEATHLQWTMIGPAPSLFAAADFLTKLRIGSGFSGMPWSGQLV